MNLRVKNWEQFQHYKNRRPPWIRLYRFLLDDPEYHSLPAKAAKYLPLIWLIAAEDEEMGGNLPAEEKLAFRLRLSTAEMSEIIGMLPHWVEGASNVLAEPEQNATPETDGSEAKADSSETEDSETKLTDASPSAPTKKSRAKKKTTSGKTAKSTPTWEAYSLAYAERYGAGPVRNSKANALCCQLVDRLGAEEAPLVAAFYLRSQNRWYSTKGHALGPLVADAEKLRTEWATGNQITETAAREADRRQTSGDKWGRAIDKHCGEDTSATAEVVGRKQ